MCCIIICMCFCIAVTLGSADVGGNTDEDVAKFFLDDRNGMFRLLDSSVGLVRGSTTSPL